MKLISVSLFLCLVLNSQQKSTPEDDHYIGAVVEFSENRTNMTYNKIKYTQLIQEAAEQNADIVVFPEQTLTSNPLEVPIHSLLRDYPIPAEHPEYYDEVLVAISAAARDNGIYVVINVREWLDCTKDTEESCPEAREYVFITNVVVDRTGAVIDRYRKINLFEKIGLTPALNPDLGMFTTDFNVTFGHFICFDLMFQVPAIQIVKKHNIKNIIFPTMWHSELPYLTAVQIQEAYAYSWDVNVLAAGANIVSLGSAGSGIYSGKAGALNSVMPGVPTTKLLVAKVPKVPGKVTKPVPGPVYDKPSDHDGLRLGIDPSLPSHVSRLLVEGSQEFTLKHKDVLCTFRVRMTHRQGKPEYQYRAMAFSGVRSCSGIGSGGVKVCSVVACTGGTKDTCGSRFSTYTENSTAIFEELSITGTIPTPTVVPELDAVNFVFYPVSSLVSLMPLEPKDFTLNVISTANISDYSLALTNNTAELYSFALWGRVYAMDGSDVDPPLEEYNDNSCSIHLLSGILALCVVVISFIQLYI